MTYLLSNKNIMIIWKYDKDDVRNSFSEYWWNIHITDSILDEDLYWIYDRIETIMLLTELELKKYKREVLHKTLYYNEPTL